MENLTAHELHHFFIDDLKMCGCGTPSAAAFMLRDILQCLPFHSNREKLEAILPNDGLEMLVLAHLDRLDLIEHGSVIGGSWITEKGCQIRDSLNALTDDEIDGIFDYEANIGDNCPKCCIA